MNTITIFGLNFNGSDLLLLVGGIIVIIFLLTRFATYNYIMKNISNIIENMAITEVKRDFKRNKRKYYNDNGKLSASANKAIQNYVNQLNISCQFYSKDFYYYYRSHRPILKCRIKYLVEHYIDDHSEIKLNHNFNNITPEQFFKLRKTIDGDIVGVYVLYNKKRKMYYVGQATRLFFRVNQHFTGHGNGDVYGDYKRGKDHFTIKLIPLVNSGYYDLDALEKDMIKKYDSYNNGYNKTRGNG